ncbi:MAG TPA: methyl-accepting chemotaxis protein, partial [bacterium]|nr:methyl-accepting chemotaxis protein [bacterium]
AIAEGKLTAGILNEKIPGELGSAFSIMTEQLRKLINKLENMLAEIKNVSVDIEGCSKIVDQTTEDFIESSKKQEVLAEDTSTAFNELSISINNVSDQSAKNKENADKTGSLAEQGYALINKVSQQMESINDSIKATASKLQELNESSRKIVNIVDIITSISEKTALLALNAAIEAARAGEAGRGFAVVADEVNKLAEQTHKSVKEISMLVDTIKLQTEMSVESMNKGLSLVSSGVEIVEQASNSFKEISNAINESNNSIANITDSINEQSKVIAQISKTTDKLKNISKEISAKSLNLQEKGKTLRTNANKLFEILKNK